MKFVVQEHFSSHHHFDFRLEFSGVAKSWAVPKGMPERVGVKRLGISVPSHTVEYMDFEGEIPEGRYGAGAVNVWDSGTYEVLEENESMLFIELKGKKLKGKYRIKRFSATDFRKWLIERES